MHSYQAGEKILQPGKPRKLPRAKRNLIGVMQKTNAGWILAENFAEYG